MIVIVNRREIELTNPMVSYDDIVGFAGGMTPQGWMITCTRKVAFGSGRMARAGVIICGGETIEAMDGDRFECSRGY